MNTNVRRRIAAHRLRRAIIDVFQKNQNPTEKPEGLRLPSIIADLARQRVPSEARQERLLGTEKGAPLGSDRNDLESILPDRRVNLHVFWRGQDGSMTTP